MQNFYALGSCSESYNFLQQVLSSRNHFINHESSNIDTTISMAEARAIAANKSHSEAERRRRKRINGHLATLRSLLPKTIKADKASLLAEVVRCIRDLKKATEEPSSAADGNECGSMKLLFPGETDELKISRDQGNSGILKATLCCEDRPQMMVEINKALDSVQAKVMKAEMATVGGRTKTVLWLLVSASTTGEEGMGTVRKAIKEVVDKSKMLPSPSQSLPGYKRPRLYHC